MERNIERAKYYTNDKYGFAIYLISRLYNDLKINQDLINSLSDEKYPSIKIYLFKITLSHLKEALKLFGTLTRSPYYTDFYNDIIKNDDSRQIIDEIKDEFENPKDHPNTVNAKYLDVRNDIFHYGTNPDDFKEYCDIQKKMENQKIDVMLRIKNNKYLEEVGVDYPKISNAFNEINGEEVDQLLGKIIKLCRNILTDYYEKVA